MFDPESFVLRAIPEISCAVELGGNVHTLAFLYGLILVFSESRFGELFWKLPLFGFSLNTIPDFLLVFLLDVEHGVDSAVDRIFVLELRR